MIYRSAGSTGLWREKALWIQINHIAPKLVVLMGKVAWHKPRCPGITYVETYHPAAAMRFPEIREKFVNDFRKIGEQYGKKS